MKFFKKFWEDIAKEFREANGMENVLDLAIDPNQLDWERRRNAVPKVVKHGYRVLDQNTNYVSLWKDGIKQEFNTKELEELVDILAIFDK